MDDFSAASDVFVFLADLCMALGRELADFTDAFHEHWVLSNVVTRISSPGAVFCFNAAFALERLALIFRDLRFLIQRVEALEALHRAETYTVNIPLVVSSPLPEGAELWLEELIEYGD